jgi:hypothetical protein
MSLTIYKIKLGNSRVHWTGLMKGVKPYAANVASRVLPIGASDPIKMVLGAFGLQRSSKTGFNSISGA